VKSVIFASALAVMAGPAPAQQMQCKTFDRSSTDAPPFVRDYFDDDPQGLFVRVCGSGDHAFYYPAGDLVRDRNVCRYSGYELTLSPASPPHLERKAARTQTYMLVSESACPLTEAINNYAATNGVRQDVFVRLVHLWQDAISSPTSFDKAFSGVSTDAAVVRQWRHETELGINRLAVRSVSLHRDLGLWKSYHLDIADPDDRGQSYAVTVSSWFGLIYKISGAYWAIY
jgi:hypothetical protein